MQPSFRYQKVVFKDNLKTIPFPNRVFVVLFFFNIFFVKYLESKCPITLQTFFLIKFNFIWDKILKKVIKQYVLLCDDSIL